MNSTMLAHDLQSSPISELLYDTLEDHYNNIDALTGGFTGMAVVEGEHQSIMDTIYRFVGHQEPSIEVVVPGVADASRVNEVPAIQAVSQASIQSIPNAEPIEDSIELDIVEGVSNISIANLDIPNYKNQYNELLWKHEELKMKNESLARSLYDAIEGKEDNEPIMKPIMVSIGTQWEKPETDREMATRLYNEQLKELQAKFGIATPIVPEQEESKEEPKAKPTKVKGKGKTITDITGNNCSCWIYRVMKPNRSYTRKEVMATMKTNQDVLQHRAGKSYSEATMKDYFTRLINGGWIKSLGANRYSRVESADYKKNDKGVDSEGYTKKEKRTIHYTKVILERYNLPQWTCRLSSRMKSIAGHCDPANREIAISRRYIKDYTMDAIKDTILHEVAHALTLGHNHDRVWRAQHIRMGGNGKTCEDGSGKINKYKKTYKKIKKVRGRITPKWTIRDDTIRNGLNRIGADIQSIIADYYNQLVYVDTMNNVIPEIDRIYYIVFPIIIGTFDNPSSRRIMADNIHRDYEWEQDSMMGERLEILTIHRRDTGDITISEFDMNTIINDDFIANTQVDIEGHPRLPQPVVTIQYGLEYKKIVIEDDEEYYKDEKEWCEECGETKEAIEHYDRCDKCKRIYCMDCIYNEKMKCLSLKGKCEDCSRDEKKDDWTIQEGFNHIGEDCIGIIKEYIEEMFIGDSRNRMDRCIAQINNIKYRIIPTSSFQEPGSRRMMADGVYRDYLYDSNEIVEGVYIELLITYYNNEEYYTIRSNSWGYEARDTERQVEVYRD